MTGFRLFSFMNCFTCSNVSFHVSIAITSQSMTQLHTSFDKSMSLVMFHNTLISGFACTFILMRFSRLGPFIRPRVLLDPVAFSTIEKYTSSHVSSSVVLYMRTTSSQSSLYLSTGISNEFVWISIHTSFWIAMSIIFSSVDSYSSSSSSSNSNPKYSAASSNVPGLSTIVYPCLSKFPSISCGENVSG